MKPIDRFHHLLDGDQLEALAKVLGEKRWVALADAPDLATVREALTDMDPKTIAALVEAVGPMNLAEIARWTE